MSQKVEHEEHAYCPNCWKLMPFSTSSKEVECPFCFTELRVGYDVDLLGYHLVKINDYDIE